jgi:hypothetical protein
MTSVLINAENDELHSTAPRPISGEQCNYFGSKPGEQLWAAINHFDGRAVNHG